VFALLLIFFVLATIFARGTSDAFYSGDRFRAALTRREFTHNAVDVDDFYAISSIDEIYSFAEQILVPFLKNSDSQNNYVNVHNKLLQQLRIRQIRVRNNSCSVEGDYSLSIGSTCYAAFSQDDMDTATLPQGTLSAGDPALNWRSSDSLDESSWYGQFNLYPGSGYVKDIPASATQATFLSEIAALKNSNWIAPGVRVVFFDFQTYNPASNLHTITRLAFEIPTSGGVLPRADVAAIKYNMYFDHSGRAQMAFEILTIIFLVPMIVFEMLKIKRFGAGCLAMGSTYVMWIILLLFFAVFGVRGALIENLKSSDPAEDASGAYDSLREARLLSSAENYLTSIIAFFMWLKLLSFFSFSRRIQFMFRTFSMASVDLVFYLILFVTVLLAFTHAGYVAFYSDVPSFRSFGVSLVSMFRAISGDLDYQSLYNSNRAYGPLYFIVFQVSVLLILVSVFLAIIVDAYSRVRQQDEDAGEFHDSIDQMDFMGTMMKSMKSVRNLFSSNGNVDTVVDPNDDGTGLGMDIELDEMGDDSKTAGDDTSTTLTSVSMAKRFESVGDSKQQAAAKANMVVSAFERDADGTMNDDELAHLRRLANRGTAASLEMALATAEMEDKLTKLEDMFNMLLEQAGYPAVKKAQAPERTQLSKRAKN
jgi:Polycystin domain/Polycystin cation channel